MIRSIRERWLFAAALMLVATFAAGLAQDLIHTDDGCQVEVHCLACQRALTSVSVGAVAVHWLPRVEVVARVLVPKAAEPLLADALASGSRAPPVA